MNAIKISDHFNLAEFSGIMPDPFLLYVLEAIHSLPGVYTITINSACRSPKEHVSVYKALETSHGIKTKGNGLGTKELVDVIPWESRHLPKWGRPNVVAVDFYVTIGDKASNRPLKGTEIRKMIVDTFAKPETQAKAKELANKGFYGIGLGSNFCHLDVERDQNTDWPYGY